MTIYDKLVRDFIKKANRGERIYFSKAVRMKCLDCMCYNHAEVAKCFAKETCPLWHLRFGRNATGRSATGTKRIMTARQKESLAKLHQRIDENKG